MLRAKVNIASPAYSYTLCTYIDERLLGFQLKIKKVSFDKVLIVGG
jgi:hypothetical protein